MVKRLQKLVQYIRRYLTKYSGFLAVSYLTFSNELHNLWSTWQKFNKFLPDIAISPLLLMRTF